MKQFFTIITLAFLAVTFNSCNKPKASVTKNGNLNLQFINAANGVAIAMGANPSYTSANGQSFSVNVLKYFISNVSFYKTDGSQVKLNNYTLIDNDPTAPQSKVVGNNLPSGIYNKVVFHIGVDKSKNDGSDNAGDLNKGNGMYWAWLGYTFFKHEGSFINNVGQTKPMLFHYGGQSQYSGDITFALPNVEINGNTKDVVLQLNTEKIYKDVDFNVINNMMSDAADQEVLDIMHANIETAFSFVTVK